MTQGDLSIIIVSFNIGVVYPLYLALTFNLLGGILWTA